MRINMPGLDATFDAAADLSAKQFKFVIGAALSGNSQLARVDLSGANGRVIGILQNKPTAGVGAVVRLAGRSKLVVDASAILVGSPLKSDGSGLGALAGTDKDKVGAIALEANGSVSMTIDALIMNYDLAV